MNTKVPLNLLASQMAAKCGCSESECQLFVKLLFQNIAGDLIQGKTVDVDGLGVFSVDVNAADPIRFTPDSKLASEINAPFNFFQPVDIKSDISLDEITSPIPDEEDANEEVAIEEVTTVEASHSIENQQSDTESEADTIQPSVAAVEESDAPEQITRNTPTPEVAHHESSEPDMVSASSFVHPIEPEKEDQNVSVVHSETSDPTNLEQASVEADAVEEVMEQASTSLNLPDNSPEVDHPQVIVEEVVHEDHCEDNAIVETISEASTTSISMIPEDEEEYVEYVQPKRKSHFWVGFFVGLMVGLILAAIAYAAYVTDLIKLLS
ncbi:MAG: hypothetical protein HDS53_07870 [Barnesiella sp.]|nr:hypothetical protein [Barnesiella sp.]